MERMTRSTARTMSTTVAGGSLRSGVAMSWVTLTPTPGPRSSPGRLAAGAEGGCGTGLGSAGGDEGLGVSSGMLSLVRDSTRVLGKNSNGAETSKEAGIPRVRGGAAEYEVNH